MPHRLLKKYLRNAYWLAIFCVFSVALVACQLAQSRLFTSSQHIAVNQIGYLNNARKIAVYAHSNPFSLRWELYNRTTGTRVIKGSTEAFGKDEASQLYVHHIDFSEVKQSGRYYIQLGNVQSETIVIDHDIFANLYRDVFRYFYFHRLGTEIKKEYVHYPDHSHAALHEDDTSLSCYKDWCGKNIKRNVARSWADAGDFGVYPVNHAMAVWSLINSYEYSPSEHLEDNLIIPESGNKIPDVLDELRYGSDFMAGMLPPGKFLASHKVSADRWSKFPLDLEHENRQPRYLQPPSTAATLAVARASSQLARVFRDYAPGYAEQQWRIAKDALRRASDLPYVYYTSETEDSPGAGDYADKSIDDDWYAALSEALITASVFNETDNAKQFRERVRKNRYFLTLNQHGSQSWSDVQGAASLSLWLHWDIAGLNFLEKDILQLNILEAAQGILKTQQQSGFFSPYNGIYKEQMNPSLAWQWGSNSFVINNMIVLAYAYRITLDHQYLHGFLQGFDYLLGTNALNTSFITGYGFNAETDTHDRIAWLSFKERNIPYPPGWLSGGPMNQQNACVRESSTPVGKPAALAYAARTTAPTAWCSKENAINWNAPLFWVAKFAVHASKALH